jgi:hypothetical protein
MADDLRIYCNRCLGITRHGVLRTFEDPRDEGEIIDWQIVRCAGCDNISFYEEHKIEGQSGWEVTDRYVYPPRQYRKSKYFVDAPANVEQLYRETISAYNGSSLVFCAGGLRALVEGICADKGITDGPKRDWQTGGFKIDGQGNVVRGSTLECLIEGLAERGILTGAHANTLHQHRYLGNEALHTLKEPDPPVLEKAINIIEFVMEGLYSIQAQADELMEIRERARNLDSTQNP